MSLCEKFKNLKLGQPAVLCVFEYIFKMQADLTISFIFKKCVSDYCFIKGSLEIDDYLLLVTMLILLVNKANIVDSTLTSLLNMDLRLLSTKTEQIRHLLLYIIFKHLTTVSIRETSVIQILSIFFLKKRVFTFENT